MVLIVLLVLLAFAFPSLSCVDDSPQNLSCASCISGFEKCPRRIRGVYAALTVPYRLLPPRTSFWSTAKSSTPLMTATIVQLIGYEMYTLASVW